MAMDSYMKGVAGSPGKQVVPVKPVESGQKAVVSKNSMQKATVSDNNVQKVSSASSITKKTSVPKSSIRKASAKKSSTRKAFAPKSSIKKSPVSGDNVFKANKSQVQKAEKILRADNIQKTAGIEEENMEVLFTMEKEPAISTIDSAISSINAQMSKTRCAYAYDEEAKRITIKVYDEETDELIREVPPEKSLEVLKKVWEMAGIMIDEKF